MALKDWKKTGVYPTPTTIKGWESKDGNYLYLERKKDMSIPYRVIFNNDEVDSTGTLAKAMKIINSWKRKEN